MRHVVMSAVLFGIAASAVGCGSNRYGYAPEYVPLSEEEPYLERGHAYSYEEVRRNPMAYEHATVAWFGIVTDTQPAEDGMTRVAMELHFHQPRHLCADQFDSSCRVTVSEKQGGPFTAVLTLRPEDREGKDRVYAGSLLKIYGTPAVEYDERGGPVLKTQYYRHWPRGTYVETGRRINMRR